MDERGRREDRSASPRTGAPILNWRARHRPVGAEHAALAFDRLHAMAASLAIVDVPTGVRRQRLVTAGRTSNDGEQFHDRPPRISDGRNIMLDPAVAPD